MVKTLLQKLKWKGGLIYDTRIPYYTQFMDTSFWLVLRQVCLGLPISIMIQ